MTIAGSVPGGWIRYGQPETSTDDNQTSAANTGEVTESFWRTMVAGKDPDGHDPPAYYSLACNETFKGTRDVNLSKYDWSPNSLHKAYIQRVQSVTWGRQLTRTIKYKSLALVPAETERHDIICILLGCSVPVVLRRIEGAVTVHDEQPLYKLIGECYMHGMMDGEALNKMNEEPKPPAGQEKFHRYQHFKLK